MAELQRRQQELKEKSNQYAEAKYWLDEFKTHIHTGDCMNADDAMIMRSMVEKIIVFDDRIDIHLRCGVVARKKYM